MRVSQRIPVTMLICALMVSSGAVVPVVAADAGGIVEGIFGAMVGAVREEGARNKWKKVDREVRVCLSERINISIDKLIQKAIYPTDPRLRPYMQMCERRVAGIYARLRQERRIAVLRRKQEKAAKDAAAAQNARAMAQHRVRYRELVNKYGAKIADLIEAGQVRIGMTEAATIAALGEPNRREIVPPSNELWYYGAKRIAFTNGKVTYIGN